MCLKTYLCHWSGVQQFEDECILLALALEIEKFIVAMQMSVIAKSYRSCSELYIITTGMQ